MSLESVLAYDALAPVRTQLAQMQGRHALDVAYRGYNGHQKPYERAAYFEQTFAAHDLVRLGGPYTDAEVHAYLAGVCHAIWVEDHVGLPWSLRDYSPREIRLLLDRTVDMTGWTSRGTGHSGCWGQDHPGAPLAREPVSDTWYQLFPLSFHLAGRQADRRAIVLAFVSWILANFFHTYDLGSQERWSLDRYAQGRRDDWYIALPDLFAQRVTGCHGPAKILAGLLRSINIPAIEIHHFGHGICYVPTLELYVHGDWLAEFAALRDNAALLMDRAELEHWIFQDNNYLSFNEHVTDTDLSHRNLALRRRGFFLFLAGRFTEEDGPEGVPALPLADGEAFYTGLQVRLPEYGIHRAGDAYYSRRVPIRGLSALPACGLAVEVDKDAGGRLRVTLENRGLDLPGNQGLLLIDVDDGAQRGGYDLPNLDQSFVQGGGRTEIATNFQLGPDDPGLVRVTVTRLPDGCPPIEVMRHLGQPLRLGGLDPTGPVVIG